MPNKSMPKKTASGKTRSNNGATGKPSKKSGKTVLVSADRDAAPLWYAPFDAIGSKKSAERARAAACWIRNDRSCGKAASRFHDEPPSDVDLFVAMHVCAYRAEQCDLKKTHTRATQRQWQFRWKLIRDYIVEQNIGLVYSMISRYVQGAAEDDVISDAHLALVNAVNRFNPRRGYQFSTYACSSIAHAIIYRGKLNRRYRTWFPVQHDETYDRPERTEDTDGELYKERLQRALSRNLAGLSDVEVRVLNRRFPQDEEASPRLTLRELGSVMGVSKERVRQIQNRALDKLRDVLVNDPVLQ